MNQANRELFELEILLDVIKKIYNIDYSVYRSSYIRRRVLRRMNLESLDTITELTNNVIHDSKVGRKLLKDISINVTDMFRCPLFFRKLKEEVFPILQTYPSIKIWHAGCSSGEEVLSLAIILKEQGLYDKTIITATDNNEDILKTAKQAIYPVKRVRVWTENYNLAGGNNSFSDYYDVKYNNVKFSKDLLNHVTFKKHNLLQDDFFDNMHLIICRNVLIYFNEENQRRVVYQFHNSLIRNGYLGLGFKETIKQENKAYYNVIDSKYKIYQKKVEHE